MLSLAADRDDPCHENHVPIGKIPGKYRRILNIKVCNKINQWHGHMIAWKWCWNKWNVLLYGNCAPVNCKKTGTIPTSQILKPLWRLTYMSYMAALPPSPPPPRGPKFGFTQPYGRSYGGIVPAYGGIVPVSCSLVYTRLY